MSVNTPELITPKEAALMLGIDRRRVYGLIDRGSIKAHDLNNGQAGSNRWLMVDRSSVVAFLESCRVRPAVRTAEKVRPKYVA